MVKLIRVDPLSPRREDIEEAARIIRAGGLVAFPTETVYGLGADAFNEEASTRIFKVKGRPADNPLIVHVSSVDMALNIGELPDHVVDIAKRVWPGPITFVAKKKAELPRAVTAGLPTVALRCPAHPVALRLIEEAGTPIAAPSANKAGKPSPTEASHVLEDLGDSIDVLLDAGRTFFGVESTIVDVTKEPPVLLRPGPFTLEELRSLFGEVVVPSFAKGLGEADVALAPGMKYRHYAPEKPLVLVEFDLKLAVDIAHEKGLKVAVLCMHDKCVEGDVVLKVGADLYEIAKNLYDSLRKIDRTNADVAIAPTVPEQGIGLAIMNRLRKASGYRIARSAEDLRRLL